MTTRCPWLASFASFHSGGSVEHKMGTCIRYGRLFVGHDVDRFGSGSVASLSCPAGAGTLQPIMRSKRLAFGSVLLAACMASAVALGAPDDTVDSRGHAGLSTPRSGRVGHAFCGADNPDVPYEGADDIKLVEAICREAVRLASACADGACATRGISLVKKLGMLPVIGRSAKIRSIVFTRFSASFTDVAVLFGSIGEQKLYLYFKYEGGHLAVDEWGVAIP